MARLELVERLIAKDRKSLVDIRDRENDDRAFAFPWRACNTRT